MSEEIVLYSFTYRRTGHIFWERLMSADVLKQLITDKHGWDKEMATHLFKEIDFNFVLCIVRFVPSDKL